VNAGVLRTNKHPVMRRVRVVLVLLAGLASWITAPTSLAGQLPSPLTATDTACTYARCSLWLDGGSLVQGAHAGVVARHRFFRPLRVLPFVTGDSARHYAALYERNARRTSRLSLAGLTLVVAGFIVALSADCDTIATPFGETCQDDASGPIAAGLFLGGYTLELIGLTISGRGHRWLGRALWWHNSQYAR
jgi:hypothetical protein